MSRLSALGVTTATACLAIVLSGCGNRLRVAEVTGTVTFQGKPVPGLIVQFQHRDGLRDGLPVATGFTDAAGRYRLERSGGKTGAVVGPNTATVTSLGAEGGPTMTLPKNLAERTFPFEVTAGANECDIDLGAE